MSGTEDGLVSILSALSADDEMKDLSFLRIGETSNDKANYVIFYDVNKYSVLLFNRSNKKVDINLSPQDMHNQLAIKFGNLSGASFEYWIEQMYLEAKNNMTEDLWLSIFNGLKNKLIDISHW